jgi:hypothetical protein
MTARLLFFSAHQAGAHAAVGSVLDAGVFTAAPHRGCAPQQAPFMSWLSRRMVCGVTVNARARRC